MAPLAERKESLWMLTVSPLIWATHFLLSYATAAIWCVKLAGPDSAAGPVRVAIGGYTLVALAGIGLTAWRGLRRQRDGLVEASPRDEDTAEDRHQFLGWATLLLSGLSAVATLYAALVALFLEWCH